MSKPRPPFVKVCGLTDLGSLRCAESLGAAYVGLITEVSRSPRNLERNQAAALARAAKAKPVMVTTSSDADEIAELATSVQPQVLQLHGSSSPLGELRRRFDGREIWQVVSVEIGTETTDEELDRLRSEIEAAREAGADKIVLDSARGGTSGGTGVAMDWSVAAEAVKLAGATPVVLAGGLNPNNVAAAIRVVRPAGVDVSSGVEAAPNVKSPDLIRSFFAAVRQVTDD